MFRPIPIDRDRGRPIPMNKSLAPSQALDFLGRAFMAAVFVNALPGKLNDFSGMVGAISSRGVPEPLAGVLLTCAIVVLALGSILFVFGSNTRLGASLLLLFLVPTTLIFHTFPVDAGFVMNLALIGGLILSLMRSTGASVPTFRSLRTKAGIWRD